MNQPAHILISGRDRDLLESRGRVLQAVGYRVSTTLDPAQTHADLPKAHLLLLCHTLSEEERRHDLDALAEASSTTKALCLTPHAGGADSNVATLDSFAGPQEMLHVVNRLLSA